MDFKTLKEKRAKTSQELIKAIENERKKDYSDDRVWRLKQDEQGRGSAIIRFMPVSKDDNVPWVKILTHQFKGPSGKWYIENCLSTINQNDPVMESNAELWETGDEKIQDIVRGRSRKTVFYSNIYVIQDKANPENEGKVFLFKYGKNIFDMIIGALQPEFEDEKPINVFDFWDGANFNLKMRKVDKQTKYDKSSFSEPSEFLDGDEEEIEKVWNSLYALNEFTNEANFKTYEELKRKFDSVVNAKVVVDDSDETETETVENVETENVETVETKNDKPFKKPVNKRVKKEPEPEPASYNHEEDEFEDDEDEDLDKFKDL
jgi:hypothetical protein